MVTTEVGAVWLWFNCVVVHLVGFFDRGQNSAMSEKSLERATVKLALNLPMTDMHADSFYNQINNGVTVYICSHVRTHRSSLTVVVGGVVRISI